MGLKSQMSRSAARNRMRLYGGIGALLLAFAALGWWSNGLQAQTPVAPDAPAGGTVVSVDAAAFAASVDPDRPAFVPGELLVGVRVEGSARAEAAIAAAGYSVDETLELGAVDAVEMQVVSVPVGGELQAAQQIAAQPGVVYVEPNGYVWAAQDEEVGAAAVTVPAPYVPSDSYYAGDQWNMQRINMARAWQLALGSGYFAPPAEDIVVAVIDSGIDPSQPEFAGRLLPGKNYVNTIIDITGNTTYGPMRDDYGHGTHVSGIIAAALNNGKGVAGVAPMVKIDPRRVLGSAGSGSISNVAQAIYEATDDGARIINMSLTVGNNFQSLADAVTYAADRGVLVVAAAGNKSTGVEYPAAYPESIAVGALSYWDAPTTYTNFGPEVDIAAPGGESNDPILSTWPQPSSFPSNGIGGYSYRCYSLWQSFKQDDNGYYCNNYGTSFASPEVAGVAALLMALNPDLSAAETRAILLETASPLPDHDSRYVGAGKLDAYAAVRALLPASVQISPLGYYENIAPSTQPFTFTVRIENPSLNAVAWSASLELNTLPKNADSQVLAMDAQTDWLSLTSGVARAQTGSAAYGKPGFLTFAVTPSKLTAGVNSSKLTVNVTTDTETKSYESDLTILGGVAERRNWFPMILANSGGGGTIPSAVGQMAGDDVASVDPSALAVEVGADSAWELPAATAATEQITFTSTSLSVALPYTVALGGGKYTTLQLFEDGFVTLPNQVPSGNSAQNRCLPQSAWYGGAVFGWWANLDSHAPGAKVTLFRTEANRVVIQYENMASVDATRPYKVSFQIVLDEAGNVRLNYRDVPAQVGKPALATIGAQSKDGRVFSEIACTTSSLTLGTPPASGDSFLIRAVDQY